MIIRNVLMAALAVVVLETLLTFPAAAADKAGRSDPAAEMAKMAALGQPGKNHQLLAQLVGSWDSKVTFWMAPGAPPVVSAGTAVRKPVMDGRYFIMDTNAKMQMPGPDGKMTSMDYQGTEIDGYDNAKGKFFSTWIDSMGTGLLISEGSYDSAILDNYLALGDNLTLLPGWRKVYRDEKTTVFWRVEAAGH